MPPLDEDVVIDAGPVPLPGIVTVPAGAAGVVVFAHGSGSSRLSPRNTEVAHALNDARLATVLFDLLTPQEALDRDNVFDIALLAQRLVAVARWSGEEPRLAGLPIGYFGASTGAAAALTAAATHPDDVQAVVSRGGRPDLAGDRLPEVAAPTLLIVGGDDGPVIDLNRDAQSMMRCRSELTIIPGAGHLFEEPGTLDQAATAARSWFVEHLLA